MDANKIKFVDTDGSIEVVEPPMTARVHIEKTQEDLPLQETIEEEHATISGDILNIEVVVQSSGLVEGVEAVKEPLEGILENVVIQSSGLVVQSSGLVVQQEIQGLVEHNIKELEKIESVLKNPEFYPAEEQKIDEVNEEQKIEKKHGEEDVDKEALSLVANAVNDVRSEESANITPKGCCILQ